MKFLLQICDPSCRCRIHIVFFRDPFDLRAGIFHENHRHQSALCSVVLRNGTDCQAHILSAGSAVHRNSRIGHRRMLTAAAVQRRGCRKAQIPVNHTEQIKRSLSRRNRNVIMIISKEMNHLIRLVDHNRRREKLLHKLKIFGMLKACGTNSSTFPSPLCMYIFSALQTLRKTLLYSPAVSLLPRNR